MAIDARVVIADDHAPMRALIRRALERGGFDVCAEVGDAGAAVAAARAERPDVIVLDVDMPGDGLTAAAEIARAVPEAAVVMLSVSRTDETVAASRQAGAVGYLLKGGPPSRLAADLRALLSGAPPAA